MEVATQQMIAASNSTPDIPTAVGGFYNCSLAECKPSYDNPLIYDANKTDDSRDRDINRKTLHWWQFNGPIDKYVKHWQYVGCYEYKSNGSGVLCETFYGTEICEGTRWDLLINSNGEFLVVECTDDWKH